MLMFTPLNFVPCGAAGVGAVEAGAEAEAATVGATDGGALVGAGEVVGVAAPQPAITTTSTIVAAVDLNRDTASSSS
jgi:Zn-dependent alcohol dehydrogenase